MIVVGDIHTTYVYNQVLYVVAEGHVDGKLLLKFNQSLLGKCICCV